MFKYILNIFNISERSENGFSEKNARLFIGLLDINESIDVTIAVFSFPILIIVENKRTKMREKDIDKK